MHHVGLCCSIIWICWSLCRCTDRNLIAVALLENAQVYADSQGHIQSHMSGSLRACGVCEVPVNFGCGVQKVNFCLQLLFSTIVLPSTTPPPHTCCPTLTKGLDLCSKLALLEHVVGFRGISVSSPKCQTFVVLPQLYSI